MEGWSGGLVAGGGGGGVAAVGRFGLHVGELSSSTN